MELVLLVFYLGFCFLIAYAGENKNIGFWGAFIVSLILSPIIGLIVVVISGKPVTIIQQPTPEPKQSKADEIAKLKVLLDQGALTEVEFNREKGKLLN